MTILAQAITVHSTCNRHLGQTNAHGLGNSWESVNMETQARMEDNVKINSRNMSYGDVSWIELDRDRALFRIL